MALEKDIWPLSEGNVVEDLERWKGLFLRLLMIDNRSPRTLQIYSGVIDEFVEFTRKFQNEVVISDIGTFFVTRFLEEKNASSKKGISSTTRSLYIKIIKSLFKFIDENNIDGSKILYNLRNLSSRAENDKKRKKPAYTGDQVEQIIVAIENIRKRTEKHSLRSFTAARNFLLTKLALYAGLRAVELSRVRYEDLEPYTEPESGIPLYRIDVHGKGDKKQYAYVLREKIDEELEAVRDKNRASGLIAISSKDKPLGPVQINHNISRITKEAGMTKQGVHIFRHTYARNLLREGLDTEIVKQLLRHEKIQTTADFYLDTDEDAKAAAAAKMGRRRRMTESQG